MSNEKNKVISIKRISFEYENGVNMRLEGDEAREFCAKTLGSIKELNQYNWQVAAHRASVPSLWKRFTDWLL